MSSSSSASIQAGLLPPFELRRLIRPVFAPDPSPADAASLPPPQPGPSKNPVIRSVDGHGQLLWVGSNDGRVRGLDIKAHSSPRRTAHNRVASDIVPVSDSSAPQPRPASVSGRLSNPSSPKPPDGTLTGIEDMIDTSCFQDCQVFPATSDKSKLCQGFPATRTRRNPSPAKSSCWCQWVYRLLVIIFNQVRAPCS